MLYMWADVLVSNPRVLSPGHKSSHSVPFLKSSVRMRKQKKTESQVLDVSLAISEPKCTRNRVVLKKQLDVGLPGLCAVPSQNQVCFFGGNLLSTKKILLKRRTLQFSKTR